MKTRTLIDDRNYRAFCIVAGPWETEQRALERARRLASDWAELGRSVPSAVLYRDGSVVWGSLTAPVEAGEESAYGVPEKEEIADERMPEDVYSGKE